MIDSASPDSLRTSAALVVAVRQSGVVLPRYRDHDEVALGLDDLRALAALAGPSGNGAGATTSPTLLDALRERGLLVTGGPGAPPTRRWDAPATSIEAPADVAGPLVLPNPVLAACDVGAFVLADHDGRVLARLTADELLAAAAFRLPGTLADAVELHRDDAGDQALDEQALAGLATRLAAVGVLIAVDEDDGEHDLGARQNEELRDGLRRQARVHQEFDRLEAEQDAVGPPGRVPVRGFHTSYSVLPTSLGMLLAAAKGHDGGALEADYDFRPRLLWDRTRLEATTDRPGIWLFSNYIWSSDVNLAHSALVKQLNPHNLTIHGGPDTPKYEGDSDRFFADHPHVDIAVHGEGEATFVHLLEVLRGHVGDGPPDLSVLDDVPGLSYRAGERVVHTGGRDRIADLDTIPSPVLMGIFDGFLPAAGGPAGLSLETNRGCPYGCTFCDWGSATLSRVRKFDLDRVFAELEWCARNKVGVGIADANFGIFERDVEIAEKIAELKATYGWPQVVGNNYAKNTVKHLSKIIEIFTEAGIVAEGKLSMQTFDSSTLQTIKRKNIKVEKYHDLSVEFRRNGLPMVVELMMGLPGSTRETMRSDLQGCIDRDVRGQLYESVLLPNSPMNDPEYRRENGITAKPGEVVSSTSSYTREDFDAMTELRRAFSLLESFAVLRQVATYVRAETGRREIDVYEQFATDVAADPERWPAAAVALQVLPNMMLPPVSWTWFMDDVRSYLVDVLGIADDAALDTVLTVQHALQPARGRAFPVELDLKHDYAAWRRAVAEQRDQGHHADWPDRVPALRELPPGQLVVDDPHGTCRTGLGFPCHSFIYYENSWDLDSPVSRPRQASSDEPELVGG